MHIHIVHIRLRSVHVRRTYSSGILVYMCYTSLFFIVLCKLNQSRVNCFFSSFINNHKSYGVIYVKYLSFDLEEEKKTDKVPSSEKNAENEYDGFQMEKEDKLKENNSFFFHWQKWNSTKKKIDYKFYNKDIHSRRKYVRVD